MEDFQYSNMIIVYTRNVPQFCQVRKVTLGAGGVAQVVKSMPKQV
jgi:hypothetical protein